MNSFNWKLLGKSLLVAVAGGAVTSVVTAAVGWLIGAPVTMKNIGGTAVGSAITTVVAYVKQSPLAPLTATNSAQSDQPNNDTK